ncbi:MAG: hypothetical protein PHU44_14945 [Syntrophales bacterium]|nr:hypothetical protein [Syntrophales bacterium]MDD5640408.1 hypothetical protein [Syntrophales bacterium]
MATRIYFPSDIVTPLTPAYDDEWNMTSAAQRWLCVPAKQNSPFVSSNPFVYTASNPPYDVLSWQFISPRLLAQTISGTVKGQFRAKEFSSSDDFCRTVVIKVVSADGSTVRGILLAHFPEALASEFATSLANRNFPPPATLTEVACQQGDRLVIELGHRSFATVYSYENGKIEIGDDSATDLPENETTTNQYCPWLEFSADLAWDSWVDAHAVGVVPAYELAPGVQANGLGTLVAYSLIPDTGWVDAHTLGLLVAYGTEPPVITKRVFPVPTRLMRYQSQWGKRKFPICLGD